MKKIFYLLPLCVVTAHLQAQKTSFVNGVVTPPGASIVLQNNNADNLSLVAKRDSSTYSRNVFTFPKALAAGAEYDVRVKVAPALMATKITNGQGIL